MPLDAAHSTTLAAWIGNTIAARKLKRMTNSFDYCWKQIVPHSPHLKKF
jgi:hypothetical protein